MATLVLQAAGAAIGNALGGPIGAIVGRAVGAAAGSAIDQRIFGGGRHVEGPRLTTIAGLASTEGAPIPRVYGRVRIGGQMIWATRFVETALTERTGSGGGKSSGASSTTYRYAANFAIGLCEGEIAFVRRVWADGKELDRDRIDFRVYRGTQDQEPDPLIVAKEGADNAPAYRGLAYVVFDNLPLADFGNRIPQLSFEVVRPVDGLARMVRAVDLIPGASEYAYSVRPLMQNAAGVSASENRHQIFADCDWTGSLDALQALCPNLRSVALVVAWFGDDLRAGHCSFSPRVETRSKAISATSWGVAGLSRATARLVSQIDGRPAYGGTPSDAVVLAALADLRARGLSVLFYPFVMMDIAPGNDLPDPVTHAAPQKAFAWRGEVTCDSADGAAAVRDEICACFGSPDATPGNWSFARMVLHYAQLCRTAGGVEAFLLGSEMRGLTRRFDERGDFPAVLELCRLASDVRSVVGRKTKISYAADWTEYGAFTWNGGDDLRFPLDALWAHEEIDFVGIDAYFPLSDWRHEADHHDGAIAPSVYDRDYLASRLAAGESFDWYYADEASRVAQIRSEISDGAYGKAWVYRAKDLVSWWSQPHVTRSNGVEGAQTPWLPRSKPIWLTEAGCPAVDLGSNAPNVFPDEKTENAELPPFSTGARDDLMQIRALEAIVSRFDPRAPGHVDDWNPVSPIYGGRMVDPDRIYVWAYDARPFPAFPMVTQTWADASGWDTGHWLNGRLESVPVDRLVQALFEDFLDERIDTPSLRDIAEGYVVDRPVSLRGVLDPLSSWFGFDCVVSSGHIRFQDRRDGNATAIGPDDLVAGRDGSLIELTRVEDGELPGELALAFVDSEWDYRPASIASRRLEGASRRVSAAELPLVTTRAAARRAADIWLRDLWIARETALVTLRPGFAALEVGDLLSLPVGDGVRFFRIQRATDDGARQFVCRAVDPSLSEHVTPPSRRAVLAPPRLAGAPYVELLDLAIARDEPATLQYLAAFADPWPGRLALWRSSGAGSFDFVRTIERSAILGETLDTLSNGPTSIFDEGNAFRVRMRGGALSSAGDTELLGGRNLLALQGSDGQWELLGFAKAELVEPSIWRLSRLLRGLGGQDHLSRRVTTPGARVVLLDDAIIPLAAGASALGVETLYRIGPAGRDHADASYVQISSQPGDLALRPYPPVRVRATRRTEGIEISFLRRARQNADGWATIDIPLDEAVEAYKIEILRDGIARRSIVTNEPRFIYTAADELEDFGAKFRSLSLRIAQISTLVGPGHPFEGDVTII